MCGGKESGGEKGMQQDMQRLQNKEKNFVSCVIYLHNDRSAVKSFLQNVCRVMGENFEKYEIVCVNDGCMDDTTDQVREFLESAEHKPVASLINLSYYQGVESAMNAGCDLAVGDFLFEFDKYLHFSPYNHQGHLFLEQQPL